MAACSSCGTDIPEGGKFCPACGAAAPAPIPDGGACASCGAELKPGARFCASCGAPSTPVPEAPPQPAVCSGCGAGLPTTGSTRCGLRRRLPDSGRRCGPGDAASGEGNSSTPPGGSRPRIRNPDRCRRRFRCRSNSDRPPLGVRRRLRLRYVGRRRQISPR